MSRYYCSGFDYNNAFGHGLGDMFLNELRDTKSIVYIPAGEESIEKAKNKYIPIFTEHFRKIGIEFENIYLITPNLSKDDAKKIVREASFIMLMGGDPFEQKKMCEELSIISELKKYNGVMVGISAGAMLMSRYIIITPCSEEYPKMHIENGLNLDNISIYPHINTNCDVLPDEIINDDEVYQKSDLIYVAKEYGDFYLLQDYLKEDGTFDISIIKSDNGNIEFYTENNGRAWKASDNEIKLIKKEQIKRS